jgi:hypothetical protein
MLILLELTWDRWCCVAEEKQGHQQHATQHIGDLVHVDGDVEVGVGVG